MAKATNVGILARLKGRRNKPIDTAPVIVGEVPAESLAVEETTGYVLLYAAIDRASKLDVHAGTRRAAMEGMEVLRDTDPSRLQTCIELSGSMAGEPLRRVIMELAAIGRAHAVNSRTVNA